MLKYAKQVLIAIDQLLNALVGGWADETLSSNAHRMEVEGKLAGRVFRPLIDVILYPLQRDHCRKAHHSELRRMHSPPSQRT